MKFLSKVTKLSIFLLSLVFAGQALAGAITLNSKIWGIDPTGTIGDSSNTVALLQMDYDSFTYVEFSDATHFTDYGYLYSTGNPALDGVYATAVLPGTISGSEAQFTGGSTMNWFDSSDNTMIELTLISGESNNTALDPENYDVEGSLTFQYQVTDVAEGYFYIWNGSTWEDMYSLMAGGEVFYMEASSTIQAATNQLVDFEENNDNLAGSGTDIVAELDALRGASVAQDALDAPTIGSFVTFNDGNVAVGVPEPGMLSMMGLACLGLAGFQLRRRKQQDS